MKIIASVWFVIFLINLLILVVKLFKINESKIEFSFWTKLFPLQFLVVIILYLSGQIYFNKSMIVIVPHGILILIPTLYIVYTAFMFGYKYVGKEFKWYNGLFLRKVDSDNIIKIILYKKKQDVRKVAFITQNKELTLRNDVGIDSLIFNYAKNNKIPVISANL